MVKQKKMAKKKTKIRTNLWKALLYPPKKQNKIKNKENSNTNKNNCQLKQETRTKKQKYKKTIIRKVIKKKSGLRFRHKQNPEPLY